MMAIDGTFGAPDGAGGGWSNVSSPVDAGPSETDWDSCECSMASAPPLLEAGLKPLPPVAPSGAASPACTASAAGRSLPMARKAANVAIRGRTVP